MRISHYLYNAFLIESGNKKIAIDPGGKFLYYLSLTTLIPKSEWPGITHIFVTHGDPDHYWHVDRIAEASGAAIVCNRSMLQERCGQTLMLSPRSKGLKFSTAMSNLHPLSVDETIELNGMTIRGIKAKHGNLSVKVGPFSKTFTPGPNERIGWGAIGFSIKIDGIHLVNLGDTLLLKEDWQLIKYPDVLMIPIGGKTIHNTMDEEQALKAVRAMSPKVVIPCHYNCPAFFTERYNPADEVYFKSEVEKLGSECIILRNGEFTKIATLRGTSLQSSSRRRRA